MGSIKCPICDERVMGKDEDDLTMNFRNHLIDVHNVALPSETEGLTDMKKGELAFGAEPTIEDPKMEGAFGAEAHTRAHQEIREEKGKLGPPEEVALRCPFCDARIIGDNEADASAELKTHLMSHDVFVRAERV